MKKFLFFLRNTTGFNPWMEVSDVIGRACPSQKMPRVLTRGNLLIISLFFALMAGYCFYKWQVDYIGTISVSAPKGAEIIIEGDSLFIKTIDSYQVPFGYGRYLIRVPKYNIECMIHKNNRGNAFIDVIDVNEFDIKCNSNAWLVKDAEK